MIPFEKPLILRLGVQIGPGIRPDVQASLDGISGLEPERIPGLLGQTVRCPRRLPDTLDSDLADALHSENLLPNR